MMLGLRRPRETEYIPRSDVQKDKAITALEKRVAQLADPVLIEHVAALRLMMEAGDESPILKSLKAYKDRVKAASASGDQAD